MNATIMRTDSWRLIRGWQEMSGNKRPSSPPGLSSLPPVGTRSVSAAMSDSTAIREDERRIQ